MMMTKASLDAIIHQGDETGSDDEARIFLQNPSPSISWSGMEI